MVWDMIGRVKIRQTDDFFIDLSKRDGRGVFFYRINGYNTQIHDFIRKYYEAARTSGVVIEGRIPNPDEKNLAYYNEIMGMNFQMSEQFIDASLKKWLPRMDDYQRHTVAEAIYGILDDLRRQGKNENMLKNAYIKFMCWLYYKFERIVSRLGNDVVPKILYEGDISNYELLLVRVLSAAGCDIVLLQYSGDDNYKKLDAGSEYSDNLQVSGMSTFPEGFSLKQLRNEMQEEMNNQRLYGQKPSVINCTNAWIEGKGLPDILKSIQSRGSDNNLFYNCFCRINGVEDKSTYVNELYQFYLELKNNTRRVVIINNEIEQPSMEEISGIRRGNYTSKEQMIPDLKNNIKYSANIELERVMCKAFVDIMLQESKREGMSLNKLTNKAVYLLCWLKRYQNELFERWTMPNISCFIHMGGCKNENEAMFIRFLARLPVDVLILNPNLNTKCILEDNLLYEVNYPNSLVVDNYPQDNAGLHIGTTAYHAERELNDIMYQDSGIYRNQQYSKASSISLQTMYEEIEILWNQEMKYRPNFSTTNAQVNMPVIFAKVSGVKDGDLNLYWAGIKKLLVNNTILIKSAPYINSMAGNPMKAHATEFLKNGKVQKNKIKEHHAYQYSVLREEIQDHILDKLQLLIDQKLIKGTFENGMEYTIVATVLNMNKDLVRLIQKFDFTKTNPKVVYLTTGEESISLEDTILMAFLNLIGFDIVFYVPTGYQTVERYFNKKVLEEHQIGEYIYDLRIPDFSSLRTTQRGAWVDKIFKRGT